MQITQVKIFQIDGGNLVAYANITIDDFFRVNDFRIFRRPTGYYITMPQAKEKDGKYREVAYALNPETLKMIEDAVIAEYEKAAGKRK